jgi:para-nitrobenzyl esterase
MKLTDPVILLAMALSLATILGGGAFADDRVKTANGIVEGTTDPGTGIRAFKGIPFAAPPVGDLRWKEPQPVKSWEGARRADRFGPRAMQPPIFGDMNFRSDGMSEDCLYLNVWTPAKSDKDRLPVLVYFYGGGFVAGDGSEPRYDGESMARKGIVAVTVNYRLNVFGFLAHPELTKESPHHASGNYGLLDQVAALRWVQRNIAAFGGDPKKVTIAGESAGSISVSALMVSPLSKRLMAGAIGESGAAIHPTLPPIPLADAEKVGVAFAKEAGASSLDALRAMSAQQVMEAAVKGNPFRFASTVDNYLLPKLPIEIFASGEQARVPLLVGWNSEEMNYRSVLGQDEPTVENYGKAVRRLYGDRADAVLKLYAASTPDEVMQAATDLAGDRFIGYSTWKWFDLHSKTGGKPVFRYLYARARPPMTPEMKGSTPGLAGGVQRGDGTGAPPPRDRGAVHSAEIEYAMGNLATNKVFAWTPEDYRVSEIMQGYFANFVKTGDPNGPGLPNWPAANRGSQVQIMVLDVDSRAELEPHRERYLFLDQAYTKPKN